MPPLFCAAAGVAARTATVSSAMEVALNPPGNRLARTLASQRLLFFIERPPVQRNIRPSSPRNGFAVIARGAASWPRLEGWPHALMVRDARRRAPHHEASALILAGPIVRRLA